MSEWGDDLCVKEHLAGSMAARLLPIADGDYDDIRQMPAVAEETGFFTLR